MTLPGRCQCSHEAGDSDCPVHPTCAECGASIEGHGSLAFAIQREAEIARLTAACDEAITKVAEVEGERNALRNSVLRVITPAEITAALNEGHAERRAAQGDNAWTALLRQRDEARAALNAGADSTAEAIAAWIERDGGDGMLVDAIRAGLWRTARGAGEK